MLATAVHPALAEAELERLLSELVRLRTRVQDGEPPTALGGALDAAIAASVEAGQEAIRAVPDAAARILEGLSTVSRSHATGDAEAAAELVVAGVEQVRSGVLGLLEGRPVGRDRSAAELVRWLLDALAVSQVELAVLLRVSPRTLQRWLAGAGVTPADEARVRLLARVVNELRFVIDPPALAAWFTRPHPHLGGATPSSVLGAEDGQGRLQALVATARY